MGANQSSTTGSAGQSSGVRQDQEVKRDLYGLLSVDIRASEDEIKKAYHKKALELHPDRNYGNVEATTTQFAEVQSAYEVLSDPQERAWYDAHREAIMRGDDDTGGDQYEHNVRVTTAEEILQIFRQFNSRVEFSDSATGFYGGLRTTFENLAREEEMACEWEGLEPVRYPSFGHADDSYEGTVRTFYAMWNGFATQKTFSWKDVYRYSEAPDRRVRRLLKKENTRLREEGVREFNDAVRSLVAFVRKRDPRYKANQQNEADRQKLLRNAATAQAARARAAHLAKSAQTDTLPEWMTTSEPQEDEISEEEIESEPQEEYECVACRKNFKSEKQYEAHEKSKKHLKVVQEIRRQMQREDKGLSLSEYVDSNSTQPANDKREKEAALDDDEPSEDGLQGHAQVHVVSHEEARPKAASSQGSESDVLELSPNDESVSTSDDEYTTRERVEERLLGDDGTTDSSFNGPTLHDTSEQLASESLAQESERDIQPKMGKAKEKRTKKAAQKATNAAGARTEFKCVACQAGFSSKTRLFNHIKDLGHAQPLAKATKGGKGNKR